MPTSVRLDTETESLMRRLTRARNQTKSEVIRDALRTLSRFENDRAAPQAPYDAVKHLIGIADSGGQRLSQQTGRKFRDRLIRKAHGRHSR